MLCGGLTNKTTFLQKSIKDKLANLAREKQNIKEEIDRSSPELLKVFLYFLYFFILMMRRLI